MFLCSFGGAYRCVWTMAQVCMDHDTGVYEPWPMCYGLYKMFFQF